MKIGDKLKFGTCEEEIVRIDDTKIRTRSYNYDKNMMYNEIKKGNVILIEKSNQSVTVGYPAKTQSHFKVGDIIKSPRHFDLYEITEINTDIYMVKNTLTGAFGTININICYQQKWHKVDDVSNEAVPIDAIQKECTCKDFDLFNYGCKCGAITPYNVNKNWG